MDPMVAICPLADGNQLVSRNGKQTDKMQMLPVSLHSSSPSPTFAQ